MIPINLIPIFSWLLKNKIVFIVFLSVFLFSIAKSFSQVIITPPPIATGGNPTIIHLMYGVLNNTTSKEMNVYLQLVCTNKGQPVADVKSKNFILPKGPTIINAINVEDLLYPVDVKYADNKYLTYGIQTSTLPPGTYQICVTVCDVTTNAVVGKNCYSLQIENFTSVNLLTPMNNSESKNPYPIFTWTKVTGTSSTFGDDIYYTLKIVEVINDQSDVIAMQANPAVFKEDEISFNLFQYPVTSQPLGPCKKYAWQIEAFQGVGSKKRSLIKSEIWRFRVECEKETHWTANGQPPPEEVPKKKPKKPVDGYSVVIPDMLKDSTSCKNFKAEFKKVSKGDTVSYKFVSTNNYTGTDSNFKPTSIKISVKNNLVIGIVDSLPAGLHRAPSKFPPGSSTMKWTNSRGYIPNGQTNLGNLYFQNSSANQFKIIYEWLNKNDKTTCKDSASFIEVQYYYELTEESSDNYSEISGNTLNVQFINNYASNSNLKMSIYDVGANALLKSTNERAVKLNSISGLNRITLNLKDYKLEPSKLYLLTVSDFVNNYHFKFKVIDNEKATNAREK